MQATLHQAPTPPSGSGPAPSGHSLTGGSWFSQPFMMAAAAVSTVLLISFSLWQRHEINQLRQVVTQLNQSSKQLPKPVESTPTAANQPATKAVAHRQRKEDMGTTASAPEGSRAAGALPEDQSAGSLPTNLSARKEKRNRPDTVYVTRYVAVPTRSLATNSERATGPVHTPSRLERYGATNPAVVSGNKPTGVDRPATDQPVPSTDAPDLTTPDSVNTRSAIELRSTRSESVTRREATDLNTRTNAATARPEVARSGRRGKNQLAGETSRHRAIPAQRSTYLPPNGNDQSPEASRNSWDGRTVTQQPQPTQQRLAGTDPARNELMETSSGEHELATNRPLILTPKDWQKALVRRARSMQSTQTLFTEATEVQQPRSQSVNPLTVQVRAGIGGEVSSGLSSLGVFSDLLLGKNWTLGLGISRAAYSAGTFMNDHDFDDRTHHDFRQSYVRGMGPRIDIQNIDIHTTRMQIPISVGYRVPLTQTLTFLPAIGTYLTLRNTETVAYYYREQPYGPVFTMPKPQLDHIDRPVNPFTTFTVGTSLEYHKGHWAAQAGPVLTIPLQETMNWQNATAVGLRARAFYQF